MCFGARPSRSLAAQNAGSNGSLALQNAGRKEPKRGLAKDGRSQTGETQRASAKVVAHEIDKRGDRGDGSWFVNYPRWRG